MKKRFKIFSIVVAVICGLNINCKADTVGHFQIYIGKTLKLTEASFNPLRSTLPFIKLDTSNYSDTININFSHCTSSASGRRLKLVDASDKTILLWEFGAKSEKLLMSIPIAEILTNSAIFSNSAYKLSYGDKEYPFWQLLTSVFVGQTDCKMK